MIPAFKKFLPLLALAAFLVRPAFAADPPFTVSNIHVDATGASPEEASNAALAQGRPKAWQILYRRLTRQQDWTRQPELDANGLLRITRSFTVANERRSTTRYVADITFIFSPEAVERLLQGAGIAYTQGTARRILLVPMSPGFQTGPWAQALNAPQFKDAVVPFSVADAADAASLKDVNFDTATWADIAPAAKRASAVEAALVQAVYANGKVTVNIRRVAAGENPAKVVVEVPLQQSLIATYPPAASAAIGTIEDMWKARSAIDFSQRGRLTVNVRTNSLAQWGAIQAALAGIDNITGITVTAMDIDYAQISISYTGSSDQLRDALGSQGLTLSPVRGQPVWSLAMNTQQ